MLDACKSTEHVVCLAHSCHTAQEQTSSSTWPTSPRQASRASCQFEWVARARTRTRCDKYRRVPVVGALTEVTVRILLKTRPVDQHRGLGWLSMSIPVVTRSRLAVVTVALSLIMALRPVSPPTERVLVTGGNGYGVPSVTACPSHPACNVQNSVATQSQQQLQNVGARQHKASRSCVCRPSQPTRCIDFSGQQQSVGYRTSVCAHRSLTQLRLQAQLASKNATTSCTLACPAATYTCTRILAPCLLVPDTVPAKGHLM
jgi:hypothetical protein